MTKLPLSLPSAELLNELLEYEAHTGRLIWKIRDASFFSSQRICDSWNTRRAGKEASNVNSRGYRVITILGKEYKAHRIAWKIFYGDDPQEIDHIDGVRCNNKISNLRSVGRLDNAKNKSRQKNNTSGVLGVQIVGNKYLVIIGASGKQHRVGVFETISEARHARLEAERRFGFHGNHGRSG